MIARTSTVFATAAAVGNLPATSPVAAAGVEKATSAKTNPPFVTLSTLGKGRLARTSTVFATATAVGKLPATSPVAAARVEKATRAKTNPPFVTLSTLGARR